MKTEPVCLFQAIDGADVRVIESAGRLRLPHETRPARAVAKHVGGEELEGDQPPQALIFGFVNSSHAAFSKLLEEAIVQDHSARQRLSHAGHSIPLPVPAEWRKTAETAGLRMVPVGGTEI